VRFLRHTLIASAALVPVVALTGCSHSPRTAAYVGDKTVSTNQLQDAVNAGYSNKSVQSSWSSQADYRRQVLQNQILHVLLQRAAKKAGVTPDPGAGSQIAQQFPSFFQNGAADMNAQLIKQGVAPGQQSAFFSDLALAAQLSVKQGTTRLLRVGVIGVPDAATAKKVGKAIQSDENNYKKLAAKYPGQNTLTAPEVVSDAEFAQPFGAAKAAAAKSHTGFVVSASGTFLVVHIFESDLPFAQAPAFVRADIAGGSITKVQTALLRKPGVKIRVNPRFGSWNAKSGKVNGAVAPAMLAESK
jgi:hypothetical protein